MDATNPLRLQFDDFELDERDARLLRSGRAVELAPKAFSVLCALARQPGKLVTKNELLDAVWGHQHVSESVLKTVVSELRAALADDPKQPRYVETASRRGYRFIAVTRPLQHAAVSAVAPMPAPTMIGRQDALAELHKAWTSAGGGQRQIFWIAGEAGVGKTTLIDNFIAGLGASRCVHGQCVEQTGAGEPYMPVLEALSELCRGDPASVPLLRAVAPAWLMQLPWLCSEAERESWRRELAGMTQDRMLREFAELMERYTRLQPLVLVTEDLHWSDHATVRLINYLARRRSPNRLMWLASFRLAEVISEDHPLKALRHELRLHKLCHEVVLDPFSEREVADYIERRAPEAEVSEEFVRLLHSHTDGLPLFVVNVIDELIVQGGLHSGGDMPPASLQVPESLAGVIETQIARLPPELRALLEAASVSGVEFRPGTVADALERDPAWVGEHCDTLVRHRHWLDQIAVARLSDGSLDARYAFRHAVYRHVFYQRIGALTRAQLHGRVAASLLRSRAKGVGIAAAELASHFEQSHDLMTALKHYAEAAEGALHRFAPMEAITITTHALALLPQVPESVERLEVEMTLVGPRGVACSQVLGVASPEARAAFGRVREISEALPAAPQRAKELSGLGWIHYVRGEFDAAVALAQRMQKLGQIRNDRILHICALNLLGVTLAYRGDLVSGVRWMEEGLVAAEEVGDELAQAPLIVEPGVSMHANLCLPLAHLGFADQACAHRDAALARAQQLGQPMAQMLALWCAAMLEAGIGDPARTLTYAKELETKVVSHALAQGQGPGQWLHGLALARLGDPDAGYRMILEGYERHARFGMYAGGTQVLGYVTEALILAARWDEAQKQIDEALALAKRIGERIYAPDLYLLQARIALGRDDPDAAREAMETSLQEARAMKALGQELSALVALCQLPDPAPADIKALKSACAHLQEGSGLAVVKRAHELIALGDRAA